MTADEVIGKPLCAVLAVRDMMSTPFASRSHRAAFATALLALAAMLVFPMSTSGATAPWIASDRDDYAPGSLVTLTGGNWEPGESVHVLVNDDQGQSWSLSELTEADDSGTIRYQFVLPDWFVALYSVSATAASGTATTSFTDGDIRVRAGRSPSNANTAVTIGAGRLRLFSSADCSVAIGSSNGTAFTTGGGTGNGYVNPSPAMNAPIGSTFSVEVPPTVTVASVVYSFSGWQSDNTNATLLSTTGSTACFRSNTNGQISLTANYVSNTAPSVTVTGVTHGASYELGSVPAAGCSVSDAQDGNSSFAATLSAVSGPLALYGLGSQTASCSYTDAGGLSASASATYSIVDTTDPVITFVSRTPAANANGWNNSDVTVSWSCSDTGSGVVVASVSQTVTSEGANQSAIGTCQDRAGNTAGETQSGINIDKTVPLIAFVGRTPAANANGWNNSDVVVDWSCSDGGSGVVAASVSQTVSTEGANQSAGGTCEDRAGNTAGDEQAGINIDKTAPTVAASASPGPNANGWNNSDVTVSFSGSDALSGIDFCSDAVVLSSEGAGQSASGTCTDDAGNASPSATASGISIDKTAPNVALVGGPAEGGSYYFGSVPGAPTCSASDGLAGLDGSCAVSGYGTSVGSHIVTVDATDKAGNSASASNSYTVLAWAATGFYAPVDMGSTVWNTVKGGSTVPLKFEVFSGSTELTSTAIVNQPLKATQTPCSGGTIDEVELLATGSTVLRYDGTSGQFIYNWQTPKKPAYCYTVTVTMADGSSISANFKLK